MLEKHNKNILIPLYFILLIGPHIKGLYDIFTHAHPVGAPVDWGLLPRVILPLVFLYAGWRAKNKNEKIAAFCFGISLLVYFNKIIFTYNYVLYSSLNIFSLVLNLLVGYQIILFYRNYSSSRIIKEEGADILEGEKKETSFSKYYLLWILLFVIIGFLAGFLIPTIFLYISGR